MFGNDNRNKIICCMCGRRRYGVLSDNKKIRACWVCYQDIPAYIPTSQDTQYIILKSEKKNA